MTDVKLSGPDFAVEVAPRTLAELMAVALEMESEAAQRYAEFADAMETHNNVEVAALFRKMASIETGHVQAIMSEMGWHEPPPSRGFGATLFEGPETPRLEDVHYLMQPYHALSMVVDLNQPWGSVRTAITGPPRSRSRAAHAGCERLGGPG